MRGINIRVKSQEAHLMNFNISLFFSDKCKQHQILTSIHDFIFSQLDGKRLYRGIKYLHKKRNLQYTFIILTKQPYNGINKYVPYISLFDDL